MKIKSAVFKILFLAVFSFAENIYFNENDLKEDTEGDLKASVSFAQNSIIPSKNTISGDVQPRLASHRKTLLIFKPKSEIPSNSIVKARVRNERDPNLDETIILKSPNFLPSIPGIVPNVDYEKLDFTLPSSYDKSYSGKSNLSTLGIDSSGSILLNQLQTNSNILISTADGAWTKNFFVPKSQGLDNKKIVFKSNAGYYSNIHLGSDIVTISRGETIVFINQNNRWYKSTDIDLSKIKYGEGFWSGIIPAYLIQPGLKITFSNDGKESVLSELDIGGYTQVLINTIRLGMLTPYDESMRFQTNPEFQRQYFQQIPASQLIVSQFEPQHFEEIVLPDGTLLNTFDHTSDGGVYTGTLRQSIGKILVSQGIDLANYGIFSSTSQGEGNYLASQVTAHKSIGNYKNGVHEHGLSGGAGMATLTSTIGNEFSHELGHNWGLGHYVGGFDGSVHRPAHQINSTWGYDLDSNIFIPNFNSSPSNETTCVESTCQDPFNGYSFNKDAMAGGAPTFEGANRYTLHTPFVLEKIQKFYESKFIFSEESSTGFEKWNSNSKTMEDFQHQIRVDNNIYNQSPDKIGAPITSIIGYYDPQKTLRTYIYPALHASYGMTYNSPNQINSRCILKVEFEDKTFKNFDLEPSRYSTNYMNKFHINVETSRKPTTATISCDGEELDKRILTDPQFVLSKNLYGIPQHETDKVDIPTNRSKHFLVKGNNLNTVPLKFGNLNFTVAIPNDQKVFKIFNIKGNLIHKVILSEDGIVWNGYLSTGNRVQSGVYLIELNGFKKPLYLK